MLCLFAIIYLLGHVLFIIFAWIIPKRRQKIFLKKMPQANNISDENQLIELENLLGYERSMDKITID
ncbi:unnamed protein product [Adineta steineri]|uniref:Uncharacterized protein n=1 Tax=Adineta steineri TaxID=433720 RepID=A0A814ZQE0_9BILA|nr:unnamed protein product [Adineta steineri]CAF1531380.1 unnamed protein product [Adineta steineri]